MSKSEQKSHRQAENLSLINYQNKTYSGRVPVKSIAQKGNPEHKENITPNNSLYYDSSYFTDNSNCTKSVRNGSETDSLKRPILLNRQSKTNDDRETKEHAYSNTNKASSRKLESKPKDMHSEHSSKSKRNHGLENTETIDSVSVKSRSKFSYHPKKETQRTKSSSISGLIEEEVVTVIPSVLSSSSGSTWTNFHPTSFLIDFTPNEDDEKNYEKCIKFWDYIQSQKDIQDLFVLPKQEEDTSLIEQQAVHQIIEDQSREKEREEDTLPVLKKFIGLDDDKVNSAFLVRDCQKSCDEAETCADIWTPKSTDEAKKLCKVMNEFDKKHPKSLEPPGLPPPLSHALMHRCPDRII